jgi:hypothetical protein
MGAGTAGRKRAIAKCAQIKLHGMTAGKSACRPAVLSTTSKLYGNPTKSIYPLAAFEFSSARRLLHLRRNITSCPSHTFHTAPADARV